MPALPPAYAPQSLMYLSHADLDLLYIGHVDLALLTGLLCLAVDTRPQPAHG